jgi:prefoldin subunit 5
MSENIKNLIKEIDDIKAEIEEKKIRCEFDKVNRLEFKLRTAKDKLVDAVREEYKNDTKTRV